GISQKLGKNQGKGLLLIPVNNRSHGRQFRIKEPSQREGVDSQNIAYENLSQAAAAFGGRRLRTVAPAGEAPGVGRTMHLRRNASSPGAVLGWPHLQWSAQVQCIAGSREVGPPWMCRF